MNKIDIILNYLQDAGEIQNVRWTKDYSVLEVLKKIVEAGENAKLSEDLVFAALLVPALSDKRVESRGKFDLRKLQEMSSPEALRLAVLYASINNPTGTLWNVTIEEKYSNRQIYQLRCLDALFGYGSNAPTNEQQRFTRLNNLTSRPRDVVLKELHGEYIKMQHEGLIEGNDIYLDLADTVNLMYASSLASMKPGTYTLQAFDEKMLTKTYSISPEQAQVMLTKFNKRFTRLKREYNEQIAKIKGGTYDPLFQFTPMTAAL